MVNNLYPFLSFKPQKWNIILRRKLFIGLQSIKQCFLSDAIYVWCMYNCTLTNKEYLILKKHKKIYGAFIFYYSVWHQHQCHPVDYMPKYI